jgi:hypothetical protein
VSVLLGGEFSPAEVGGYQPVPQSRILGRRLARRVAMRAANVSANLTRRLLVHQAPLKLAARAPPEVEVGEKTPSKVGETTK